MRHLTDDEIQGYLDGPAGVLDHDTKTHLDTCPVCRNALEEYRMLYTELADDTGFEIPPDLAKTVMAKLGLKPHRHHLSLPADIVLVCGVLIAIVAVALYYVDFGPLLDALTSIGTPLLESASPRMELAHDYLVGLNHALTLALAGMVILVLMGSLDLAFQRKRSVTARRRP